MMSETKTKTKTKTTLVTMLTPKASQFRRTNQLELDIELKGDGSIITNNIGAAGCGYESSFRVLYYGDAAAGSIPFMWESHPGKPKHATTPTPPPPPPITPPPAIHHQNNIEKYNINSPKQTPLGALFRTTSARKSHVGVSSSDSSISYDSSKQSTSLRSLFLASSSSSTKAVHMPSSSSISLPSTDPWTEDNDGGSPMSTLCFGGGGGGGFMKVICRRKKVKSVIKSHPGKTHKKKLIN